MEYQQATLMKLQDERQASIIWDLVQGRIQITVKEVHKITQSPKEKALYLEHILAAGKNYISEIKI